MGTEKVMRYEQSFMDELERLDQQALQLIGQREEVRRRLGNVFLRIKALLGHGQWKIHFERTFAHLITLHTAANYMRLAHGEQYVRPKTKRETVSLFPPAADHEAVGRRKDAAQAQAEVEEKQRRSFRPPPVLMNSVREREDMEELWRVHRREAEKRTIRFWRKLRDMLRSDGVAAA